RTANAIAVHRHEGRMLDLDAFSKAVAGIYDASMNVERWNEPLSLLSRAFDAKGGQFVVASGLASVEYITLWGWTDEELATFMPRYLELTPSDPRMAMVALPYKATHCRQVISDEELWASAMYKEVLQIAGVEYIMCFLAPIDDSRFCTFAL